jgi:hypothetical protein
MVRAKFPSMTQRSAFISSSTALAKSSSGMERQPARQ